MGVMNRFCEDRPDLHRCWIHEAIAAQAWFQKYEPSFKYTVMVMGQVLDWETNQYVPCVSTMILHGGIAQKLVDDLLKECKEARYKVTSLWEKTDVPIIARGAELTTLQVGRPIPDQNVPYESAIVLAHRLMDYATQEGVRGMHATIYAFRGRITCSNMEVWEDKFHVPVE